MDAARFRLLNDWQHDFPRVETPYAELAQAVGMDAEAVLAAYRAWLHEGTVSRIGPVVASGRVGASALVALAVPSARLAEVAARVSQLSAVNHNYEREHPYNLWFVATAGSAAQLQETVERIAVATGCAPLLLPMEEAYHIDLGFDLGFRPECGGRQVQAPWQAAAPCRLAEGERALLGVLQHGLPAVARPYAAVGERLGLSGAAVCAMVDGWLLSGLLRRFGVVVRHHELGYAANAMCVWDVADEEVADFGRRLGAEAGVTLCYRRRRALPQWRYNLFCMIHGKVRAEVLARRAAIADRLALDRWPHAVLFSRRRFKQCGAHYMPDAAAPHAREETAHA